VRDLRSRETGLFCEQMINLTDPKAYDVALKQALSVVTEYCRLICTPGRRVQEFCG
jgi:hypothetical protein